MISFYATIFLLPPFSLLAAILPNPRPTRVVARRGSDLTRGAGPDDAGGSEKRLLRHFSHIRLQGLLQMLGRSCPPGGTIESFVAVKNDRRLALLPRSLLQQGIWQGSLTRQELKLEVLFSLICIRVAPAIEKDLAGPPLGNAGRSRATQECPLPAFLLTHADTVRIVGDQRTLVILRECHL